MEKIAELLVGLILEYQDFLEGVDEAVSEATSKLESFAGQAKRIASDFIGGFTGAFDAIKRRFSSFVDDLSSMARTLSLGLSLPMGFFLKMSLDVWSKTEYAARQALALMVLSGEATEESLRDILNIAMSLSVEYGKTAEEIAASMFYVLGSGFETLSEAQIIAEQATKAAIAGFTDTSDAAKTIVGVLRAYMWGVDQAEHVTDVLFQTVNLGVITFHEMSRYIGLVSALAVPLGIELEELGANIAYMTRRAVPARIAMTNLRWMMVGLMAPTKKAIGILESYADQLGWTGNVVEDLQRSIAEVGLIPTLKDMYDVIGPNEAAWRFLFGSIQATTGLMQFTITTADGLTQTIDSQADMIELIARTGFDEYNELFERMQESMGATETVYQTQAASFQLMVARMQRALEVLELTVGETIAEVIAPLVEEIAKLGTWFAYMTDETKKFAAVAIILATVLPPILFAFTKLISVGGILLSLVTNPLTLAFGALVLVFYRAAAAGREITDAFDVVLIAVEALTRMVDAGTEVIYQFAQGMIAAAGYVIDAIGVIVGVISSFLGASSPPEAGPLHDIVLWGLSLMEQYLYGMTLADFGILDEVGRIIQNHLERLEFDDPAAALQAQVEARLALARVISEISQYGRASQEAWDALRTSIHDATGELEQYIKLRMEQVAIESELARVQAERDEALGAIDARIAAIQQHWRERLLALDKKIAAVRDKIRQFELDTAEIPERFTRGRRRQLEMELWAAEKERREAQFNQQEQLDALRAQREAMRAQYEERINQLKLEREQARSQADWLMAMIKQKEWLLDLEEKYAKQAEKGADRIADAYQGMVDQIEGAWGDVAGQIDLMKRKATKLGLLFAGIMGIPLSDTEAFVIEQDKGLKEAYVAGKNLRWEFLKLAETLGKLSEPLGKLADSVDKLVVQIGLIFEGLGIGPEEAGAAVAKFLLILLGLRAAWFVLDPIISIFGGIASAALGVIGLVAQLVGSFAWLSIALGGTEAAGAAITGALSAIGSAISSILAPLLILAAAVGAVAYAWLTNWGGIRDWAIQFFESDIRPLLDLFMEQLGDVITILSDIGRLVWNIVGPILKWLAGLFGSILIIVAEVAGGTVLGLLSAALWALKIPLNIVKAILEGLTAVLQTLVDWVKGVADPLRHLRDVAEGWGQTLGRTFLGRDYGDVGADAGEEIAAGVEAATPKVEDAVDGYRDVWDELGPSEAQTSKLTDEMDEFWKSAEPSSGRVAGLQSATGDMWASLVPPEEVAGLPDTMEGIWDGFGTTEEGALDLAGALEDVWDGFDETQEVAEGAGEAFIELGEGIGEFSEEGVEKIAELTEFLPESFDESLGDVDETTDRFIRDELAEWKRFVKETQDVFRRFFDYLENIIFEPRLRALLFIVEGWVDDVIDALDELYDEVRSASGPIHLALDYIRDEFDDFVDDMWRYGFMIIMELIRGMRSGLPFLDAFLKYELNPRLPHSEAEKGPLSEPVDWEGYVGGLADILEAEAALLTGALSSVRVALSEGLGGAVIAPGVVTARVPSSVIYWTSHHHWDASISAKDRVELKEEMQAVTGEEVERLMRR